MQISREMAISYNIERIYGAAHVPLHGTQPTATDACDCQPNPFALTITAETHQSCE
jgi:hypothetical protein